MIGFDGESLLEKDSSAAKGIGTRKGLGKVKRLKTRTFWLQDQVGARAAQDAEDWRVHAHSEVLAS